MDLASFFSKLETKIFVFFYQLQWLAQGRFQENQLGGQLSAIAS